MTIAPSNASNRHQAPECDVDVDQVGALGQMKYKALRDRRSKKKELAMMFRGR